MTSLEKHVLEKFRKLCQQPANHDLEYAELRSIIKLWQQKIGDAKPFEHMADFILLPLLWHDAELTSEQQGSEYVQFTTDIEDAMDQFDFSKFDENKVNAFCSKFKTLVLAIKKSLETTCKDPALCLELTNMIDSVGSHGYHKLDNLYGLCICGRPAKIQKRVKENIESKQIQKTKRHFDPDDSAKFDVTQEILQMLCDKNYRKCNEVVYAPIKTTDGYCPNYYGPIGSIQEVLETLTSNTPLDEAMQNKSCYDLVIRRLTHGVYPDLFPEYKTCRYQFAFEDAVYDAKEDKFYDYAEFEELDESIKPCRFFQGMTILDKKDNDFDIPHTKSVILYQLQKFKNSKKDEILLWMLGMFGRCLFDVREMDEWQVMVFLFGFAGTGKGLLISMLGKIYEKDQIGTLSDNLDPKFGLTDLYKKSLNLAPEIGIDFKLDVSTFNSMVSGEQIVVNEKFAKNAKTVQWKTPTVMAGNLLPRWPDNSNALTRRIVFCPFSVIVPEEKVDHSLCDKLDQEIGSFVVYISRCYHKIRNLVGHKSFWNVIPDEFDNFRRDILAEKQPITSFVKTSGSVIIAPRETVRLSEFEEEYKTFCRTRSLRYMPSHDPSFGSQMAKLGLRIIIEKESHRLQDNTFTDVPVRYVKGCSLIKKHFVS